jgi:SAM-dependent methyltransferase
MTMNKSISSGYISPQETIKAAERSNQNVTDYVETLWNIQGQTSWIIQEFRRLGALKSSSERICEIGTGTGMYADTILRDHGGCYYESYEVHEGWAEWLSRTYKIVSHPATGDSLGWTPTNSIDLVHANGVFVYTPFLVTVKYICEMFRVTKPGGYAVFDIFSERCFEGELLKAWLKSEDRYPCIFPHEYVKQFFIANGFQLEGEFFSRKFGEGKSHYLVFQKR